jgi:hypothetical protein
LRYSTRQGDGPRLVRRKARHTLQFLELAGMETRTKFSFHPTTVQTYRALALEFWTLGQGNFQGVAPNQHRNRVSDIQTVFELLTSAWVGTRSRRCHSGRYRCHHRHAFTLTVVLEWATCVGGCIDRGTVGKQGKLTSTGDALIDELTQPVRGRGFLR